MSAGWALFALGLAIVAASGLSLVGAPVRLPGRGLAWRERALLAGVGLTFGGVALMFAQALAR